MVDRQVGPYAHKQTKRQTGRQADKNIQTDTQTDRWYRTKKSKKRKIVKVLPCEDL